MIQKKEKTTVRRLIEANFFQCANCGYTSPSLVGQVVKGRNVFECPSCGKTSLQEEMGMLWKTVTKKVYAYLCEGCGEYVPNTSDNTNFLGIFNELLCPKCYEGSDLKLIAINGYHISRLRTMGFDSLITAVENRKHRIVLRYLNILAKKENPAVGFRSVPQENLQAYIATLDKPVGYLAYTKDDRLESLPVIRQLFVVKEERRKGHATRLVKYFLMNECKKADKDGNLFVIELPNDKSLRLLQKLGYVKTDKNGIQFINCYEIQCM